MIPGRARVLNVLHAVDLAREAHPELQQRLNWTRLLRILERERISLLKVPLQGMAEVIGIPPYFVILLNSSSSPRHHTRYAAHEYAHIRLHFGQPGETVRNLSPCQRGDPREWEAELFARMLMLGASATMDTPEIARLADRIVAHATVRARPAQLPLQLPPAPPAVRERPDPRDPEVDRRERTREFLQRRQDAQRALRGSTIGRGCSHDALRYDWTRDGKPLRFFDYEFGWLEVSDFRRIETTEGKTRIQQLVCGDSRAEVRAFVVSSKDQRRYRFGAKEKRGRSVKELEKQLRAAKPIPQQGAPGTPVRTPRDAGKESP